MRKQLSLTFRLVFFAAIWTSLVLAASGFGLAKIFGKSVEASFDREISASLDALSGAVNIDENGNLIIDRPPPDPRYTRPLSGYYWRIADIENNRLSLKNHIRSRSLYDENLEIPQELITKSINNLGNSEFQNLKRGNENLRFGVRTVSLPDRHNKTIIIIANDRIEILKSIKNFNLTLLTGLGLILTGLIIAIILQVRLGLLPVRKMREELSEIRNGSRDVLNDNIAKELAPLASELNALIVHNTEVVERARTHVGNLAHALKTPISVMMNESAGHKTSFANLVSQQSETMLRQVEHYLKRARVAARAETLKSRTPIMPIVNDITRTLSKLYKNDGIALKLLNETDKSFRGEQEDLEDLFGNLAENACKYGGGLVEISFESDENNVKIIIDDDGDGLTEEQAKSALKRGVRLDETSKGSGLGLSIADELAKVYGGSLNLSRNEYGGLRVVLSLPLSETTI